MAGVAGTGPTSSSACSSGVGGTPMTASASRSRGGTDGKGKGAGDDILFAKTS